MIIKISTTIYFNKLEPLKKKKERHFFFLIRNSFSLVLENKSILPKLPVTTEHSV